MASNVLSVKVRATCEYCDGAMVGAPDFDGMSDGIVLTLGTVVGELMLIEGLLLSVTDGTELGIPDGIGSLSLGADERDGTEEGSPEGWLLGSELAVGTKLVEGFKLGLALMDGERESVVGNLLEVGTIDNDGVLVGAALGVLVGASVCGSPPALV